MEKAKLYCIAPFIGRKKESPQHAYVVGEEIQELDELSLRDAKKNKLVGSKEDAKKILEAKKNGTGTQADAVAVAKLKSQLEAARIEIINLTEERDNLKTKLARKGV